MSLNLSPISAGAPPAALDRADREMRLRSLSQEMEASFLAEMLKAAGLGEPREGLGGGGAGEEQFGSFLRAEQARLMVEAGGIGLAEHIFNSLMARGNGGA